MTTRQVKPRGRTTELDRRRLALEAQRKQDRLQIIKGLRDLADLEDTPTKAGRQDASSLRFASQLLFPDWLTEVPLDLSSHWFVQLRPQGRRVIAIIKNGKITLRNKHGRVMDVRREVSLLGKPLGFTMLDCVIDEGTEGVHGPITLHVMDLIFWDQMEMSESEADCRHFWLASRFSECPFNDNSEQSIRLIYAPPIDATCGAIQELYSSASKTRRFDSFLFTHKSSQYSPGLSPLVLQWRDQKISRYAIDTDDVHGLKFPEMQSVVLRAVRMEGGRITLQTWDSVVIGTASEDDLGLKPDGKDLRLEDSINDQNDGALDTRTSQEYYLVRGLIRGVAGNGSLLGLSELKIVPAGRAFPDSFARIQTQAGLRAGTPLVSIRDLLRGVF